MAILKGTVGVLINVRCLGGRLRVQEPKGLDGGRVHAERHERIGDLGPVAAVGEWLGVAHVEDADTRVGERIHVLLAHQQRLEEIGVGCVPLEELEREVDVGHLPLVAALDECRVGHELELLLEHRELDVVDAHLGGTRAAREAHLLVELDHVLGDANELADRRVRREPLARQILFALHVERLGGEARRVCVREGNDLSEDHQPTRKEIPRLHVERCHVRRLSERSNGLARREVDGVGALLVGHLGRWHMNELQAAHEQLAVLPAYAGEAACTLELAVAALELCIQRSLDAWIEAYDVGRRKELASIESLLQLLRSTSVNVGSHLDVVVAVVALVTIVVETRSNVVHVPKHGT